MFHDVAAPLVAQALAGHEACVLAYGQTGSGKTHTLTSLQRRAVAAMLDGGAREVRVTFFELIGDRCTDLLAETSEGGGAGVVGDADEQGDRTGGACVGSDGGGGLQWREVESGELRVSGLREVRVSTCAASDALLGRANAARATAPTAANDRSSRSHAVCTLLPVVPAAAAAGRSEDSGPEEDGSVSCANGAVHGGSLVLVDLAGSERREEMARHGRERMSETRATNVSLSALKDCVRLQRERDAMSRQNSSMASGETSDDVSGSAARHLQSGDMAAASAAELPHVPYRRSKLTRLLRRFLCGEGGSGGFDAPSASCVMLAHLAPMRSAGKHSASTLELVGALCGASAQRTARAAFNAVERWSPAQVTRWVAALDGGAYAHLAPCFGGMSGKMLSVEWLGHVVKRVAAQGGEERDAHRIYEAFHERFQAAKAAMRRAERAPRTTYARRQVACDDACEATCEAA